MEEFVFAEYESALEYLWEGILKRWQPSMTCLEYGGGGGGVCKHLLEVAFY